MKRISLHGGHSGQFCDHARDTLAEIVAAYHAAGFECVGLTEHMPPFGDTGLYPDEVELGRTAEWMQARFADYVTEARRLEREYRGRMRILVGMESEWYPGCAPWVAQLREKYGLDYVVGSVHHVGGECFDFSRESYGRIAGTFGGPHSHVRRLFRRTIRNAGDVTAGGRRPFRPHPAPRSGLSPNLGWP